MPEGDISKLDAYIAKIQAIYNADLSKLNPNKTELYDSLKLQAYAKALSDLQPKQAALLLSTQNLTGAQIQQSLAAMENAKTHEKLTVAEQYQAMADAGLLAGKKKLTVAQAEQELQSVLGSTAAAQEALQAIGVKTATDAQRKSVVALTEAKISEMVATGKLTEAQAMELGMRLKLATVTFDNLAKVITGYINHLFNLAKAIKNVALQTAKWLLTNPTGQLVSLALLAAGSVATLYKYSQSLEETRKKTLEASDAYSEQTATLDDYIKKYKDLQKQLIEAQGDEEATYNVKQQLFDLQKELNEKYGEEAGRLDLVTDAYKDQTTALMALNKQKAETFLNDNRDGINRADKKMTETKDYQLSSHGIQKDTEAGQALQNIVSKYADQGMELGAGNNALTFSIVLKDVNVQQANDTISDFMTDVRNKAKELGDEHLFDGILDMSENAKNEAKSVIDDFGEIFKQKHLAEIAEDDSLTRDMNTASIAIEKYNEAVLKSSNPLNDKDVATARKNLQDIQNIMTNAQGWSDYQDIVTDVFKTVDTSLYDFTQDLQNDDALKSSADMFFGMTETEIQALIDAGDQVDVLKNKYAAAVEQRKKLYSGSNYVGNVDINNRPVIVNNDGSYSTTSTAMDYKWEGTEEDGQYKILHYTPILPDGTILEGDALEQYINKILDSSDSLSADNPANGGYGIVYKVDFEVNGQKITDGNLQEALKQGGQWDVDMHNTQDNIYGNEARVAVQLKQQKALKAIKDYAEEAEIKVEDISTAMKALGIVSNETASEAKELNKPLSKTEMISELNGLSEGFEELDKIMASMADKDKAFDFSLLDDKKFKDTFGTLGQEYEDFIEKISNSPKDVNACQGAFDALVTKWIQTKGVLDDVTEETAGLTEAMLTNMGVANASEVVADALERQAAKAEATALEEQYLTETGNELTAQTWDTISSFSAQNQASQLAQQELAKLKLAKLDLNNNPINLDTDISAVLTLAKAANVTASKLKTMKTMADLQDKISKGENVKGNSYLYERLAENLNSDTSWTAGEQIKFEPFHYTGGNKTANTNTRNVKNSKDKSDTKKEFDWIERKHKLMEEEMSKLKEQSSDTSLRYTGLDNDTINRALELFDKIHNQVTISTDDFSWLAQAASSAGMSLDEFFLYLQDGGGVSRMSALQEILERDKKDLETYTQDAQTYASMYEEAVSKLAPEYREKIEHGGNDVEELPDKENEAVQKAVDLYDKKKEAEQKVTDTQKEMHETQVSMYDLELEELEKQNDELEGRNSLITKQIDYLNTSGRLVNGTAYETLIANLGKQKSIIEQELEVKKRELAAMMESNPDYENSQEYYDLQKSISDSELSLIDLTNQQAEYNDTLRQLPINNMQKVVDMYNNISTAMENWKNEIESAGKSVDADYYQEQIKNGQLTIKQLQEQRAAVEDVMDEYEAGSDKWAEMNSKLTDIDSSISSIVVNMNEWNEAMLQIPIDKMEKLVSDLKMVKDALDDVNSEHQTVISAVTGAIDDQREAWEEAQKAETDAIQDKIDAIQDQLDLLDKQNEALDLQVAKEQALKKLEDAKTQKKNRVVRDGEVVYEADQDAIREAADSLQDAEANLKKHELETEKEKLEDELDAINDKYDDLYDKLDKIANKWDKIQSDREQLGNEQVANRYLGDDWINKVLSGNDDDIYGAFKDLYNQNVDSQEQYNAQIKSTEQIQTLVNTYIEAYRSGTLTRDQAMSGIKSVLSSVNHEMTAGDNVHNILTYLSTQNSTGATTNDILNATKNQLSSTSKDIMKSLDVYEKNSNTITKYMSSFGDLTSNVSDMRSTIHTVSKNLDSIEDTISDGIDDIVDAINSINIEVDRESSTSTKHETSSAPNGWQGTHEFDHDNGKEGYEVGWTRKYANGIEEGPIGNAGDKEKYMAIREMATTDLKPSEQPILAHTGEIVLNPEQQAKLLKNIQQSTMAFRPETLNLKPVNVPMIERVQPNVVYNNYGNFELKDVRDVDGFAKAVGRDFDRCMKQTVSKRW